MLSARHPPIPTIALLSVTSDGGSEYDLSAGTSRQDLAGGSLIEYQINTLARAGVQRFLIEVENVDGSLIALADRCRGRNQTVDFVRTGADAQRYIDADDRIWVQSGLLYVQWGLVETLVRNAENFIATVDSRDENAAFERIDINTRWAGVSVVGPEAIAMLRDLPDDWSLISSLLRQALLTKIQFRPLSQKHINNGTLTVLTGAQDFSELNRQILRRRIASRSGFVEAQIFGPIFARLVPVIWQSSRSVTVTKYASPVLAAAAVTLGFLGSTIAASVAAFMAITANCLRLAVTDDADGGDQIQPLSVITWALVILAMFGGTYMASSFTNNGLFAAFAVASLSYITHKMALPNWAKQLLHSPAALALFAVIGAVSVGLTAALQWIMVLQLSVLIIANVRREAEDKKAKQP